VPLVMACLGPLFMESLMTGFYKSACVFSFVLRLCSLYLIKYDLRSEGEDSTIYKKKVKSAKES